LREKKGEVDKKHKKKSETNWEGHKKNACKGNTGEEKRRTKGGRP